MEEDKDNGGKDAGAVYYELNNKLELNIKQKTKLRT